MPERVDARVQRVEALVAEAVADRVGPQPEADEIAAPEQPPLRLRARDDRCFPRVPPNVAHVTS